ncbi:MAG: hypothetical protein ACOH5I_20680 [Oligoflexus sp.]
MLVRRVLLFLLIGWLITFSGIALLSSIFLEESQAKANLHGLRYWQEKVDQYVAMGASLEEIQSLDQVLNGLKAAGQNRLDNSHLFDPYGHPYELQNRKKGEWYIVSAGPDGLINTTDDVGIAARLVH